MVFKDFLDYFADLLRLKISYTKLIRFGLGVRNFQAMYFSTQDGNFLNI